MKYTSKLWKCILQGCYCENYSPFQLTNINSCLKKEEKTFIKLLQYLQRLLYYIAPKYFPNQITTVQRKLNNVYVSQQYKLSSLREHYIFYLNLQKEYRIEGKVIRNVIKKGLEILMFTCHIRML